MDRAEAVMDKKEKKVEKSKGRARNVQERAKAWEELNKKMIANKEIEEASEEANWADEPMEDPVAEEDLPAGITEIEVDPLSIPLPQPAEDEEEL
jgi:hypothetical protein